MCLQGTHLCGIFAVKNRQNHVKMATIKIYNDIQTENYKKIASFWGEAEGVCFKDIDAFCAAIPDEDTAIDIRLHCDGGSVMEGWAIYDRLRQTGKEITATIEGNCASMATIILLAAPKERRRAYENAHICIHNPWLCPWALGDAVTADDLQKYANDLRSEQERMVSLYVERTGSDAAELQNLMNEDKYIDTTEALRLGLISEIVQPISAKKEKMTDEKKKASMFDRILAKMGFKSSKDLAQFVMGMDLNTADGNVITIVRKEGEPQVGDQATPDGEWLMPDGTTIVVEQGVIVEVRPAAPEEETAETTEDTEAEANANEDKEGARAEPDAQAAETTEQVETDENDKDDEEQRLRDRIAELEKENEELRQKLAEAESNAKTTDDMRILNKVRIAGGEKALASLSSTYKPASRQPDGEQAKKQAESGISADAIREKYAATYGKKKTTK